MQRTQNKRELRMRGRPPDAGRSAHERRNAWSAPRNPAGSPSGREREKDVRGPSASPGVAAPRLARSSRGRRPRRPRQPDRARCGQETPDAGSFRPAGPEAPTSQETAGGAFAPLRGACRVGGKTKVSDSPCPPQWGQGRRGSTLVPQGLCLAQGERGNNSEDGPTRILRAPAVDFGSGGPEGETAPTGGD
ncbi:hypothetical protein NDU88_007389 [Pleurodeles waltl]|uniref:Uncharacterized protein n=1 Tax=Pleurodeles waltl TaxID=8319 RepID=A0AAV7QNL7_PLEWA|nr:hypothetical protein NDU88_007389 [Pleurodeles waltl]